MFLRLLTKFKKLTDNVIKLHHDAITSIFNIILKPIYTK